MKTSLQIVALLLLPAALVVAQPPLNQNNPNGVPPQGQGNLGGPGPRGFMGPPPNAMFSLIDADGDGTITKTELRRAVRQLSKLDTDKDGNITLAEASVGGPGGPGGPFGDPAQFVNGLMQNDANGDGRLTIDEVPDHLKPMLQGADANGDNAIDRNELAAVAQNMQNMRNRFGGAGPGGPGGLRGPGRDNGPFDPTQMTGRLMQFDRNGDGRLTPDELPAETRNMLQGGDQNNDGAIDPAEMQEAIRRMGARARALNAGLAPGGDDNRRGANAGGRDRKQNQQ
jgi:Ca2+-binding EF-hand superfamily protein